MDSSEFHQGPPGTIFIQACVLTTVANITLVTIGSKYYGIETFSGRVRYESDEYRTLLQHVRADFPDTRKPEVSEAASFHDLRIGRWEE